MYFICDSFIFEKDTIFCSYCSSNIKKAQLKIRLKEGVFHYFLFNWSVQNDLFCRTLVYGLKRKKMTHFSELAASFNLKKLIKNNILVCPSKDHKVSDHAASFSYALEKLFGCRGVLRVGGLGDCPQKQKKTRSERLKGAESLSTPIGDWLFVDDVFVTGGTCYKISGFMGSKPKAIITLFYKELERA